MSEKNRAFNSKRNQRLISIKNTNSKIRKMTPKQNEDITNYQTEGTEITSYKYKKDNPISKPQSNSPMTSNLLNTIKRSIFVSVNKIEDSRDIKNSSNALLTSPHVSQGLKNKYSQIYLETINQINSNEKTNLLSNMYHKTTVNDSIIRKREEIMAMLNANNSLPNNKINQTCRTSMANSPTHRNKRQLNIFKELSSKAKIFANTTINSSIKPSIPRCYPINTTTATNSKDEVFNKLNIFKNKGKSNSIKIVNAQNHFEKILNNEHKPITFSSNVLKKTQRKIERKTQINADKEETENFLNVLTIKNNFYNT